MDLTESMEGIINKAEISEREREGKLYLWQ